MLTRQNLSFWTLTQQRRRKHRARLGRVPTLSPNGGDLDIGWSFLSPAFWRIDESSDAGDTWETVLIIAGTERTFTPPDTGVQIRIVGLNVDHLRVTDYSDAIDIDSGGGSVDLLSGILAAFLFDEAFDSSSPGQIYDIINGIALAIGDVGAIDPESGSGFAKHNGGIFFNSEDTKNANGNNAAFHLSGDRTFSFWCQPADNATGICIGVWQIGDDGSSEWVIFKSDDAGNPAFNFYLAEQDAGNHFFAAPSVAADDWTHVLFTYEAATGTMSIYQNGVLLGTVQSPAPNILPANQFVMGCDMSANFAASNVMDELYIWNRILNGDEIAALANESFYPF